ncbi:aminotransferase-like domain-containing protein [Bordetella petrii]|uniref:Transcriptional regulator, GntR-family n=1 Tax=Bordetella petrii (strain ATCC BAA-461 / DSM 12804 / CCUG 43448 / CIP 107267 / Se-1111R) TaxID=340100 RepID=A9IKA8_BORPD|nr:aminotransferase class I/II-fold pyridoxal phosphate-dependent enzyme [Bordetella petrii]CAP42384.1 transcriptional regulator, GntR-family [Bordetella petrii]
MDAQPLYQRLADHYRRAIQSGVLAPAERMPSVRSLVRTHRVSLSTALQACRQLEDDGLIEARPRSGYFVRPRHRAGMLPAQEPDLKQPLDPASYVGIHDRVSDFIAQCERHATSVDLGLASASPAHYPADALKQAMIRTLRGQPDILVKRVPPLGHPELRSVLARRALDLGMNLAPDEIVVTHGCIEALNLALRAVARPGDTVAVESPVYFGLLQVLESLGMRALEVPTSPQRGLSVDALELAMQTHPHLRAVVVVPNFQNPLGCVMPDTEKARLVTLCERHQVALIEDDTYGMLCDDNQPQPAVKSWDRTGNVIYCASMHKTLAPGMRLGWMTGGRWSSRIAMLKFAQSRPNEPLAQAAVAEYMGSKAYDRHLARLRRQLKAQRELLAEAIARHFPAGTRLNVPEGSMLLWIEMPGQRSSMQVFEQALSQGIRIAPGIMFSNSDRYSHFLRLSCGSAHTPELAQAVRTLGGIVAAADEKRSGVTN